MTRISKDPDVRRREIMDIAREMFHSRGYDRVSVDDIMRKAGVSKGLFYYYFKSKEEILDAIVDAVLDDDVEEVRSLAESRELDALQKLRRLMRREPKDKGRDNEEDLLDYLHQPENSILHQKTLVRSVLRLSPLIASILEQGNAEGVFSVPYPKETAEFLLAATSFLYDPAIFGWSNEELKVRCEALADILAKTLGAPQGSFDFVKEAFGRANHGQG